MSRKITLSFDNGPTPGVTDEVLDVLKRANISSSFFVIGDKLHDPAALDLVERAHHEGHWIGNHTTTHTNLFGVSESPTLSDDEIEMAQSLIGGFGHPDRLFRPYAGGGILDRRVFSRSTIEHLRHNGYTCVMWNSIPRDWEEPDRWVDNAMEQVAQHEWTLTVIHDLDTGAMKHLGSFLDRLNQAEVEIVQDFPTDCLPIVRGQQCAPLDHLMPEVGGQP